MSIQISLHFYRQELMFLLIYWQRVNAHSGFSSFLQTTKKLKHSLENMGQCPFGLLFISTTTTSKNHSF